MEWGELKRKWNRKTDNRKLILGLVVVLVAVVISSVYFLFPDFFKLGPELKVNAWIGNFTKFEVNSSCISAIIPYFVDVKFNELKISNATVDIELIDLSEQMIGKINLYYDSYTQLWKTTVGYTCLTPEKHYALANVTTVINGKEITVVNKTEINLT